MIYSTSQDGKCVHIPRPHLVTVTESSYELNLSVQTPLVLLAPLSRSLFSSTEVRRLPLFPFFYVMPSTLTSEGLEETILQPVLPPRSLFKRPSSLRPRFRGRSGTCFCEISELFCLRVTLPRSLSLLDAILVSGDCDSCPSPRGRRIRRSRGGPGES